MRANTKLQTIHTRANSGASQQNESSATPRRRRVTTRDTTPAHASDMNIKWTTRIHTLWPIRNGQNYRPAHPPTNRPAPRRPPHAHLMSATRVAHRVPNTHARAPSQPAQPAQTGSLARCGCGISSVIGWRSLESNGGSVRSAPPVRSAFVT